MKSSIIKGDCLSVLPNIEDKSIDMVLCDLPYGVTSAIWDTIIPFDKMWLEINRICRDNAAVVLFGQEPFSTFLRMSNIHNFKYDYIWVKHKAGNFAVAKYRPLCYHEIISVFCINKNKVNYYPQKIPRISERVSTAHKNNYIGFSTQKGECFYMSGEVRDFKRYDADWKLPSSVLNYPSVSSNSKEKTAHPTQKPVQLLEYLIRSYTKENESVLDFTMGSGSTGVACINTNRNFIGIEKDDFYFDIAKKRLRENTGLLNEFEEFMPDF